MMKLLDTLHRWTGGLIGLLLALLGLSGTILLHKDAWIGIPHAGDPLRTDLASVTAATETIMALPGAPQGIIYAHDGFGLHQGRFALGEGAGFYADQSGRVVGGGGACPAGGGRGPSCGERTCATRRRGSAYRTRAIRGAPTGRASPPRPRRSWRCPARRRASSMLMTASVCIRGASPWARAPDSTPTSRGVSWLAGRASGSGPNCGYSISTTISSRATAANG